MLELTGALVLFVYVDIVVVNVVSLITDVGRRRNISILLFSPSSLRSLLLTGAQMFASRATVIDLAVSPRPAWSLLLSAWRHPNRELRRCIKRRFEIMRHLAFRALRECLPAAP